MVVVEGNGGRYIAVEGEGKWGGVEGLRRVVVEG